MYKYPILFFVLTLFIEPLQSQVTSSLSDFISQIKEINYKEKVKKNIKIETIAAMNYYYGYSDKFQTFLIKEGLKGNALVAWVIANDLAKLYGRSKLDCEYIDKTPILVIAWLELASEHGSPRAMVDLATGAFGMPLDQKKYNNNTNKKLLMKALDILNKEKHLDEMDKRYLKRIKDELGTSLSQSILGASKKSTNANKTKSYASAK